MELNSYHQVSLHKTHTHEHTAPDDYTAVPHNNTIPVVFAAGRLSTRVFIHINNDNITESDELFFGRIRMNDLQVVTITQDTAEITIRDDDCKSQYTAFLVYMLYTIKICLSVHIVTAKSCRNCKDTFKLYRTLVHPHSQILTQ